jgi:Cys-tRNA(Pro)/Cys-tRNA(Cys) deacylase
MKTNGARFLENLGIAFELREYEVDPEDLSATTVAKKIGMPAEQVFKTLLTTGGPGVCVFAVIPGNEELDFKKLARAVFGAKKPYPVFVDETAILFDRISVSAGTRGTQLVLSPEGYLRAAEAKTADLTKDVTKATAPEGRTA